MADAYNRIPAPVNTTYIKITTPVYGGGAALADIALADVALADAGDDYSRPLNPTNTVYNKLPAPTN